MSVDDAKKKALTLLEKRDYSRCELIKKLTEKGVEEPDATAAVERLCQLRLISDENYAAMVVRHYAAKGFGPARIRDELRRRYIPREMWDEALEALPEQENTVDALLRRRLRSAQPDRDELRRAADALRRRGFSWDEVREAVERFNNQREEI